MPCGELGIIHFHTLSFTQHQNGNADGLFCQWRLDTEEVLVLVHSSCRFTDTMSHMQNSSCTFLMLTHCRACQGQWGVESQKSFKREKKEGTFQIPGFKWSVFKLFFVLFFPLNIQHPPSHRCPVERWHLDHMLDSKLAVATFHSQQLQY